MRSRHSLLDAVATVLGSLDGILFIADALHTQTAHAHEIAARGAHLMVPAKGDQPTLFAQLKALPWPQIPAADRTRDTGHGRRETRTVKAITVHTPGGIAFPHAQQAVRTTRTRTNVTSGKTQSRNRLPHRVSTRSRRATRRPAAWGTPAMGIPGLIGHWRR
jgi:hypothetical protein